MGTDISGRIEVRTPNWGRTAGAPLFGCLFGVCNFAGFDPVAPDRGVPADAVPADGEWQPVWDVVEALAAAHSPEKARLVVWFDS